MQFKIDNTTIAVLVIVSSLFLQGCWPHPPDDKKASPAKPEVLPRIQLSESVSESVRTPFQIQPSESCPPTDECQYVTPDGTPAFSTEWRGHLHVESLERCKRYAGDEGYRYFSYRVSDRACHPMGDGVSRQDAQEADGVCCGVTDTDQSSVVTGLLLPVKKKLSETAATELIRAQTADSETPVSQTAEAPVVEKPKEENGIARKVMILILGIVSVLVSLFAGTAAYGYLFKDNGQLPCNLMGFKCDVKDWARRAWEYSTDKANIATDHMKGGYEKAKGGYEKAKNIATDHMKGGYEKAKTAFLGAKAEAEEAAS